MIKKPDKKYVLALHLIDLISKEDKVICDDVMAEEGFKEKDINYKYWFEIDYIDSKKNCLAFWKICLFV